MPTRTRRAAALAADMRMDVDGDDDEQMDDDDDREIDEVEDGLEDEEDEEDEIQSAEEDAEDDDDPPSPAKPLSRPLLKIKLKLSQAHAASSTNSTNSPTPDDIEAVPSRSRRRTKRRNVDIESEDPTPPSSDNDELSIQNAGSRSTTTPSRSTKPMTTRQAVLASVVDSSHVSLNEGSRPKKQPLNETELALRREETARKRKNLTEKKLEDEKAETINRLLKKQSRPKNKRTVTMDDRSPMPSNGSRFKAKLKSNQDGDGDVEIDEDDEGVDLIPEESKPTSYRWVSTSANNEENEEKKMVISFSVPDTAFSSSADFRDANGSSTEAPANELKLSNQLSIKGKGPGSCAINGCGQARKYRLVKDWTVGACGLNHLRLLEER